MDTISRRRFTITAAGAGVGAAAEKNHRAWWWIGEQPGKWLESAIYASASGHDSALRNKAEGVLKRMIAAQDPDGYMGITAPGVRTARRPIRGMDPYELYFTLHALVTAKEQWGSELALTAAMRLGDFEIQPKRACTYAAHEYAWVPAIYQATGDKRMLSKVQGAWAT